MQKIIQEMFQLQNNLNIATNGEDWVNGVTKEGKIINWERASYLETAELIDSYPWKHWKGISQQPDLVNAQIEVVDIWHFIMSSIIETTHLLSNHNTLFQDSIMTELLSGFSNQNPTIQSIKVTMNQEWTPDTHKQIDTFLEPMENFINQTILLMADKKTLKRMNNVNTYDFITQRHLLQLKLFFVLMEMVDLDLQSLYTKYLGKNLLNQFRQNNGYKEGTYIKIWNGKEDNIVMLEVIEEYHSLGYDAVYSKIDSIYQQLS
jgi:hypothetical protein